MVAVEREEKTVAVPGGKLAYEVAGKGMPVLCLPSLGDTRREYERFAPALVEAGYQVIVTELRGMGQSRGNFKTHNVRDLTNDIKAILDNEKIERAILVACSVSGASAGLFAVENPQRVAGLIMFNPIMHTGPRLQTKLLVAALRLPLIGRAFWGTYFKSLYPARPLEADYMNMIKAELKKPGAMKSVADMCDALRIDQQISQIKSPSLIFFGSKDPDFKDPQAEAKLVESELAGSEVVMIDGFGHYLHRECPELVLPKVLEWCKRR